MYIYGSFKWQFQFYSALSYNNRFNFNFIKVRFVTFITDDLDINSINSLIMLDFF